MMEREICRCSSSDCILCNYDGTYSLDLENPIHRNVITNFLERTRTRGRAIRSSRGERKKAAKPRKSRKRANRKRKRRSWNGGEVRREQPDQSEVSLSDDSSAGSSHEGSGGTQNISEMGAPLLRRIQSPTQSVDSGSFQASDEALEAQGSLQNILALLGIQTRLDDMTRAEVEKRRAESRFSGHSSNTEDEPFANDHISESSKTWIDYLKERYRQLTELDIFQMKRDLIRRVIHPNTTAIDCEPGSSPHRTRNIEINQNSHETDAPTTWITYQTAGINLESENSECQNTPEPSEQLRDRITNDQISRFQLESESKDRESRNIEIIENNDEIVTVDQQPANAVENSKSRLDVEAESSTNQANHIETTQNSNGSESILQELCDRVENFHISRLIGSENSTIEKNCAEIIPKPENLDPTACELNDRAMLENTNSLNGELENNKRQTKDVEINNEINDQDPIAVVTQKLEDACEIVRSETRDVEYETSSRKVKIIETNQNSRDLELGNISVDNDEISRIDETLENRTEQMNDVEKTEAKSEGGSGPGNSEMQSDAAIKTPNDMILRGKVSNENYIENELLKGQDDTGGSAKTDFIEKNTSVANTTGITVYEAQLTGKIHDQHAKEPVGHPKPVKMILRRKTDIQFEKTQHRNPKKRHSKDLKSQGEPADYWEVINESLSDPEIINKSAGHDNLSIPASPTNIPMTSPMHQEETKGREVTLKPCDVYTATRGNEETVTSDSPKNVQGYSESQCADSHIEQPRDDPGLEVETCNAESDGCRKNPHSISSIIQLDTLDKVKRNTVSSDAKPKVSSGKNIAKTTCDMRQFKTLPTRQNSKMITTDDRKEEEDHDMNLDVETPICNPQINSVQKVKESTSNGDQKIEETQDTFIGIRNEPLQARLPLKVVMKRKKKIIGPPHALSSDQEPARASPIAGEQNSTTLGKEIRSNASSSTELSQPYSKTQHGSSVQSKVSLSSDQKYAKNKSGISINKNTPVEHNYSVSSDDLAVSCGEPSLHLREAEKYPTAITTKRTADIHQTISIKPYDQFSSEKDIMENEAPSYFEYTVTSVSRDSGSSVIVKHQSDWGSTALSLPYKQIAFPSNTPKTHPKAKKLNTEFTSRSSVISNSISTTSNRSMSMNATAEFRYQSPRTKSARGKATGKPSSNPSQSDFRIHEGLPKGRPFRETRKTRQPESLADSSIERFVNTVNQGFDNYPTSEANTTHHYSQNSAGVDIHALLGTSFLHPELRIPGVALPRRGSGKTPYINALANYWARRIENVEFIRPRSMRPYVEVPRSLPAESMTNNCTTSFERPSKRGQLKKIPTPRIPSYPRITSGHDNQATPVFQVPRPSANSKQQGLNNRSSNSPFRESARTRRIKSQKVNYYSKNIEIPSSQRFYNELHTSEAFKYPPYAPGHYSHCPQAEGVSGLSQSPTIQPALNNQGAISARRATGRSPYVHPLSDVGPKLYNNPYEDLAFQTSDLPSYPVNLSAHSDQYTPGTLNHAPEKTPSIGSRVNKGSKNTTTSLPSKSRTNFRISELLGYTENASDDSSQYAPAIEVPDSLPTYSSQDKMSHRQTALSDCENQNTTPVGSKADVCEKQSENILADQIQPKSQGLEVTSHPANTSGYPKQFTPANSPRQSELSLLPEVVDHLTRTHMIRPMTMPTTHELSQSLRLPDQNMDGTPNRHINHVDEGVSVSTQKQRNSLNRTMIENNKNAKIPSSYSLSKSDSIESVYQSVDTSNSSSECVNTLTDVVQEELLYSKQAVMSETVQSTNPAYLEELQAFANGSTPSVVATAVIRSPAKMIPDHRRSKSKLRRFHSSRTLIRNVQCLPSSSEMNQQNSFSSASVSSSNMDHVDHWGGIGGSSSDGQPQSVVNYTLPGVISSTRTLIVDGSTGTIQSRDGGFSSVSSTELGTNNHLSIFGTVVVMPDLVHRAEYNSSELSTPGGLNRRYVNQITFGSEFLNNPHTSVTGSFLPTSPSVVHSQAITSSTSAEVSLVSYIQDVQDIISSIYGSDRRSRTSENRVISFITESNKFISAESILLLRRFWYSSLINGVFMANTFLSDMSQLNLLRDSTRCGTFLNDGGSHVNSMRPYFIHKRTSAALHLPSPHDIDPTLSPKKPRLLPIESSLQIGNGFESANALCNKRVEVVSQEELSGGTTGFPENPQIMIQHITSTAVTHTKSPILGAAKANESRYSVHRHIEINEKEQHFIAAASSVKALGQSSEKLTTKPPLAAFIRSIDDYCGYSREIRQHCPTLCGPNVDHADENSQSIEFFNIDKPTECRFTTTPTTTTSELSLVLQPPDDVITPQITEQNYPEHIESVNKRQSRGRRPSSRKLTRNRSKVRYSKPLKSFRNRRILGCLRNRKVQKQRRSACRVTQAYSQYLCNTRNIQFFVIICDGEGFLIKAELLTEASPLVRQFIKTCALTADSEGRCIIEVRGIAGWAMEEMLNYLYFNSYNAAMMKSSSVAKVAKKFEIKINRFPGRKVHIDL